MCRGEIKETPKWNVRSREVSACPWLRLCEDEVLHADGTVAPFALASRADSVMVVCELADGRVVMTEQYLYAAARWSPELPQGGVEEGESLAEAALRELREETGWHGADPQVPARQLRRDVEAGRICDAATLAALGLHRDAGARGATAGEEGQ